MVRLIHHAPAPAQSGSLTSSPPVVRCPGDAGRNPAAILSPIRKNPVQGRRRVGGPLPPPSLSKDQNGNHYE